MVFKLFLAVELNWCLATANWLGSPIIFSKGSWTWWWYAELYSFYIYIKKEGHNIWIYYKGHNNGVINKDTYYLVRMILSHECAWHCLVLMTYFACMTQWLLSFAQYITCISCTWLILSLAWNNNCVHEMICLALTRCYAMGTK